jgi:hypothetical protein
VGFFDSDALSHEASPLEVRRILAGGVGGPGHGEHPAAGFSAYPRLEAPAAVAPDERFQVIVGFQAEEDPSLHSVTPIHIENPPPDASLSIMLVSEGAEVLGGNRSSLPLDMRASITFDCQVKPEATEVSLTVFYFYGGVPVGTAMRELAVASSVVAVGGAPPTQRPDPCRLGSVTSEHHVDMTVIVKHTRDGHLYWEFESPHPSVKLCPFETALTDARGYAGSLIKELQLTGYEGPFAHRILKSKGQELADLMPLEFFETLQQLHKTIGRMPVLLLLTDEPYMPWELARLPTKHLLDSELHPFLGVQTCMGRWFVGKNVACPPPTAVDIERLTVVASEYGQGTGQRKLPEALTEQRNICESFGQSGTLAFPLEAMTSDLASLLSLRKPGHLVHFAIHGRSNPGANEQLLILADKARLSPGALTGDHECGQTPDFSFVFLNACQVGTAGSSLGVAAGFPGHLLRDGAFGVIAPLWAIHDEPARMLAEGFYANMLTKRATVAEFLQEQRAGYDSQGTTTPLAYIFYGHPNLRLQAAAKEAGDA